MIQTLSEAMQATLIIVTTLEVLAVGILLALVAIILDAIRTGLRKR